MGAGTPRARRRRGPPMGGNAPWQRLSHKGLHSAKGACRPAPTTAQAAAQHTHLLYRCQYFRSTTSATPAGPQTSVTYDYLLLSELAALAHAWPCGLQSPGPAVGFRDLGLYAANSAPCYLRSSPLRFMV